MGLFIWGKELEEDKPIEEAEPAKRGRGRPKGSKNKNRYGEDYQRVDGMTSGAGRLLPPTASRHDDFSIDNIAVDPATLLSAQMVMLRWQQLALNNKIRGAEGRLHGADSKNVLADIRSGGRTTVATDTRELLELTNAVARQIEAMGKHTKMAKELAAQMSAEDLLEAAIVKLEGQSLPTLNYAIKRLRAKREMLAPVLGLERLQIGHEKEDEKRAVDAIADLLK